MKPRCADLFCGAGGAAMGLSHAGFEVEGWDIVPQKHFPFTFHLGNALDADLSGFDFVWASPPCQAHTAMKTMHNKKEHPDLIPATRAKFEAWGSPWIIENVVGAPLINPVMLCGTMFGLKTKNGTGELRRHRLFESSFPLLTMDCSHSKPSVGCYGHFGGRSVRDGRHAFHFQDGCEVMGIDWMNSMEICQAIPPAYSEFLGRQIIKLL